MRKPQEVIDAITAVMCSMGNAGRGVNEASLGAARTVYDTREKLAGFFGAEDARQIVFTMNSTESLNIAIKGILNPGDHVISTVLEHNSVLRPLYEMEKKGVEVTFLGCDEKGTLDYADFDKAIKENTKAIVCTHGSNLTGNKVDVERIGEIAKKHDLLFVVDASQTAGVFPIDVQKMHIDILCFTGHKGLLGPQGTGGMYVRKGVHVRPLLSGGTGVQTYSKTQPEEMPTALEAGTLNGHGIAGLDAAIGYLEETGIDTIRAKEQALMKRFYEGIKEIPGVKIYGDFSSMDRCAVVSLNIRDYDSGEVSDALLTDYGISTRSGGHCAPLMHEALGTVEQGAVRFSFSHYNTEEEVDTRLHRKLGQCAQGDALFGHRVTVTARDLDRVQRIHDDARLRCKARERGLCARNDKHLETAAVVAVADLVPPLVHSAVRIQLVHLPRHVPARVRAGVRVRVKAIADVALVHGGHGHVVPAVCRRIRVFKQILSVAYNLVLIPVGQREHRIGVRCARDLRRDRHSHNHRVARGKLGQPQIRSGGNRLCRGSRFCTSIATGLPATRILTNRTSGSAQSVVAMDKHTVYSSWMPICSAAEDKLTVQTCPAVVTALPCASDTLP